MAITKHGITGAGTGPEPPAFLRGLTYIFATGLGSGFFPWAQGTIASALFVILWVLFVPGTFFVELLVALVVNLVSIPLSSWGERLWGHDPGRVTIDEFAGQAVALLVLPTRSLPWLFAAFILFRFFDVFKFKFVRRYVESLPGGLGVTLDDTVAGIFAGVILFLFSVLLR